MEKRFFSLRIFSIVVLVYVIFAFSINFGLINSYWAGIFKIAIINVILVVSLNLATGFLGQLTLAHSGFMAIGAYVSVIITKLLSASGWFEFPFALICGGLAAMIFAFAVSIPAMKITGNYLVIITLAVNEIIRNLIINLNIQGGSSGSRGLYHYSNFTIVYCAAVLIIVFIYLLINSKYGRSIVCIPQNEMLAKSCSINTFYYKLAAFSLAAFFAGIAGGLYAHEITVIEPNMFDYSYSLELLAMVIIGGLGSIVGSVISAIVLTVLPYMISFAFDFRIIIYLSGMIAVVIYMPSGLFSDYKNFLSKFYAVVKEKFFNIKNLGEKV